MNFLASHLYRGTSVKKPHRDRAFMDSINLDCPLPSDDRPECRAGLCMKIALLMSTAPLAISNALPARGSKIPAHGAKASAGAIMIAPSPG